MRDFSLPKEAAKDLKTLGGSIIENDSSNKKTVGMANAILAATENKRKSAMELVTAVENKVVVELMQSALTGDGEDLADLIAGPICLCQMRIPAGFRKTGTGCRDPADPFRALASTTRRGPASG